jgi:thioredoxin reductase
MSEYDVLIIGGGAAGLSAALVLARARRSIVVIDGGAPRNAPAAHMHGFLSRDGVDPATFLAAGRSEVQRYGGEVRNAKALDVVQTASGFCARLSNGETATGRRVLLATGLRDVLPDIPGIRERWGKDLLHCPYCHGWEVRDQPLGVLGADHDAVQHALLLRQWSSDVILFTGSDRVGQGGHDALIARGVRIVSGAVASLAVENDRLVGVSLADGVVVPRDALFVRPRFAPNDRLAVELGCASDGTGWLIQDGAGRTSVDGVWVAGNAGDPRAQVITAAGEGSAAAISINGDLVAEDIEIALSPTSTQV